MTYEESDTLMKDPTFGGRVKVACLKYADSIQNEASNVAAHNARLRWAQGCWNNPDGTAALTVPPTVMDPAVQAEGSAIADLPLQGSVETVVNKML